MSAATVVGGGRGGGKFITPNKSKHRAAVAPYEPGQYDHLLRPREHLPPAEILALTVDVQSDRLFYVEHSIAGNHPKTYIRDAATIELRMPNGDEVLIEITRYSGNGSVAEPLYLAVDLLNGISGDDDE